MSDVLRDRIVGRINALEESRRAAEVEAARLDAAIGELHSLLSEVEVAEPEPEPAPRRERDGAPKKPRAGRRESVPSSERAAKVARLLSERGPLQRSEIMQSLGFDKNAVSAALASPWFRKQQGGLRAPWELTEAGRSAVAASGGG